MSDKKPKPTEEQLQQLKQLQLMLQQQQGAKGAAGNSPAAPLGPKKPSIYTPKGLLMSILLGMQSGVKFIDQFINFIINKKSKDTNDVLESSRSPIIFGFWIIFIFVFLGTIWAATAPLDSAAVAIGTVISDTKKRIINHSEPAIINKIFVKVGDEVKEGDKLIEFDDKKVKYEFEGILSQYRYALANESRLIAEINGSEKIDYHKFLYEKKSDAEVSKIIETQDSLFYSKRESINTESDALKQRIKQFRKQIEGYEARKISNMKTLEVVQDRLDATKKLNKKGYVQKAALLELEDREARTLSEIAIADTEIARTEQQITEVEITIINLKSKALANALNELKDSQTRIPELAERYRELETRLSRMVIISPVDGVVNKLEYTTIGSAVQPIVPLVEISPKNDKLVIEAKIIPKDIDSIKEGLVSKIRFSAFKSRVSPIFLGKIISLSPDIIIEANKPQPDQKLMAGFYLAQIELDMEDFNRKAKPRELKLKPGMQAEVQIVTGTRTLLRYLLDPVFDAMFKGFKER